MPAFERFLDASVPWLARLKPYLGNFVPIFDYINSYRREIAAFFANSTATTQGQAQNRSTRRSCCTTCGSPTRSTPRC